jgi:hypothetical protein
MKRSDPKRRLSRREQRQRKQRAWLLGVSGAVVLFVALLVYAVARPRPGKEVPILGNQHIQPPQQGTYNSTPPTSGPHYPLLANWGVHGEPVSNELQVHNLEDGGVMVQYNCSDGCAELVSQLKGIVERYPELVILAPYPQMEPRIALTAWGRIDTFDRFDRGRIVRFIKAYRGLDHHRQ